MEVAIHPYPLFSKEAFDEAVADIIRLGTPDFIEENRIINYCDTKKDGSIPPSVIQNQDFLYQLNALYPPHILGDYVPVLKTKINDIMQNRVYGDVNSIELCFMTTVPPAKLADRIKEGRILFKLGDTTATLTTLPTAVTHAIQESGYSPVEIKSTLITIITPASYIDPASRQTLSVPTNISYSGWPIPATVFKSLGFEKAITSFTGQIDTTDNVCNITIQFPSGLPFTTTRDEDFNHLTSSDNINLFLGNGKKNTIINRVSSGDHIKKLILFKELGDTLQVVYAKLLMGGTKNKSLCLFTVDAIVAARCRELGVPVSLQFTDTEFANLGKTLYYPLEPARAEDILEQYYTNCLTINKVTKDIFSEMSNIDNNSIKIQLPSLPATPLIIKPSVKTFFTEIVKNINEAEGKLAVLKAAALAGLVGLNEDAKSEIINNFYRETVKHTTVPNIITKFNDTTYICLANMMILFALSDAELTDAIRSKETSLDKTIQLLNKERAERVFVQPRKRAREEAIPIIKDKILAPVEDVTTLGKLANFIREGRLKRARKDVQRGGVILDNDDNVLPPFMNEYYDLVAYIIFELLLANNDAITTAWDTIYTEEMSNAVDPIDDLIEQVGDVTNSFINVTYIYFNYIQRSCLNETIIGRLIKEFIINGLNGLNSQTWETFKVGYDAEIKQRQEQPLQQRQEQRLEQQPPVYPKYTHRKKRLRSRSRSRSISRSRSSNSVHTQPRGARAGGVRITQKSRQKRRTRKNCA